MVCNCVRFKNLEHEAALARVGLQRQKKESNQNIDKIFSLETSTITKAVTAFSHLLGYYAA